VICYILALSNSEKAIVFPFILILYEFSFGTITRNWSQTIAFWITSFVWGLTIITRISDRVAFLSRGSQQTVGVYNPLQQIPVALTSYFELIFWPEKLTLYHYWFNFFYI
jgi:hypothetical protein